MNKGEIYLIRNGVNAHGDKIIEGEVTLIFHIDQATSKDEQRWKMEFTDEPGRTFDRYVLNCDQVGK